MDERSPYAPPAAVVDDAPVQSPAGFGWRRVLGFTIRLYLAVALIGLVSGLTLDWWPAYPNDIAAASDHARLARRIAMCVAAFALYLGFLRPLRQRRFAHVAALFLAFQVLDLVISLAVFRQTLAQAFGWRSFAVHVVIALAALALSGWHGARTSAKVAVE